VPSASFIWSDLKTINVSDFFVKSYSVVSIVFLMITPSFLPLFLISADTETAEYSFPSKGVLSNVCPLPSITNGFLIFRKV
jgi:hypothetical protein